jgi:rRNA maturation protein Nop10
MKIHVCKKCGVEYNAIKESSEYCGRHRHLQSPAKIKQAAEYVRYVPLTAAEKLENHRLANIALRRRKGIGPRVIKIKEVVPEVKYEVISVQVETLRPAMIPEPEQVFEKPAENFFLRVNAKTMYSFTTRERMENFKKRHPEYTY